jgi:hypothetical protein
MRAHSIACAGLTAAVAAGVSAAPLDPAAHQSQTPRGTYGQVTMDFRGFASDGDSVVVDGSTYPAGHIVHDVLTGPGAGGTYATFCVEIQQSVATGPTTYDIVDLTDARIPGPTLTQEQADGINAVVANAVALGWIDGRLQADESQDNYSGRMAAIQAAIWDAMGFSVDVSDPASSDGMQMAYMTLLDDDTFDGSLRLNNLKALANDAGQDMLYVIPLPPAAWAGAGMLAACFGVRTVRRRG